jgi:hypothetical protein
MITRQSTVRKSGIGVLVALFIAGWALPDVFAAGLGSGGKKGGSSSSSSSTDRGAGSPIISEKSSPGQSSSPSSPTSSGQSSTTPLSTPSDSQTSYKTYSQPDSVETSTSPEGSVGMEASAPGSKKKKATGGGFPPADTTTVTATEGDTAIAIRGKPAHSGDAPTKGSEVAGGGSSKESGGPSDLEKIGRKAGDVVQEGAEGVKGAWDKFKKSDEYEGLANDMIWSHPGKPGIGREGRQVLEQFKDADKNIRNETGRAPQNIQDFFSGKNVSDKQLRENIDAGAKEAGRQLEQGAESAKVLWDLLRGHDGGMNPFWEGVKGEEKWFRDTGAKIDTSYKGSDIYKGAKQLEGAVKLPDTMQPGHLFEEGRRSFGNTPLGRGLKDTGDTLDKGAKQLEGAGKKLGDTLGKAGKDVGGVLSDAEDAAGKAVDKASDYVSDTAQQGEDAASDAGSSAAETVCDWFGC